MFKILFVTSEVYPFIKTGGLADVAASLPRALTKLGQDIRILLPAYASVLPKAKTAGLKEVARCYLESLEVIIWQTRLPGSKVKVWLVDFPGFSEREGNPYCGPDGDDWPDNARRFYDFSRVAHLIATEQLNLNWRPDIVHCNDWQTGPVPALLAATPTAPPSVFTIHNLAYRGLFPRATYDELQMPMHWWHADALEFYGELAFIKGGLAYANKVTTVSPSYAQEIQTAKFGCGLEGLLSYRQAALQGILNGIDTHEWNPGRDKHLVQTYNRRSLPKKTINKLALQKQLGLPEDSKIPLLGFIGRMVEQKGIALILAVLTKILAKQKVQCVMLGSGVAVYETALTELGKQYPEQLSVTIGYSESLAHQIEAGVDIFLMPSAFEPCGLNQLYSLRYGTLPIVHSVGGLRDSIVNYLDETSETANGFVFTEYTNAALQASIEHALKVFKDKSQWRKLQLNGMNADLSWEKSAQAYLAIYQELACE